MSGKGDQRKLRGRSGRALLAEGVAARRTLVVVEYVGVDLATSSGTDCTPGRASDKGTEDSAKNRADRPSSHTKCGSSLGTTQSGGGSAGSTNGSASLTGIVSGNDVRRSAAGTGKGMVHISASCRIRANGVAQAFRVDAQWGDICSRFSAIQLAADAHCLGAHRWRARPPEKIEEWRALSRGLAGLGVLRLQRSVWTPYRYRECGRKSQSRVIGSSITMAEHGAKSVSRFLNQVITLRPWERGFVCFAPCRLEWELR